MTPYLRPLALCTLLTLALGGCYALQSADQAPRSPYEGTALIAEIRDFERGIAFAATNNFQSYSEETKSFPFCGHVSRHYLPYSYQDPAIQWFKIASEDECRAFDQTADISYGETEAVGERATPVTLSMLSASLDRFVYVVIHEDCHEQFELPHGIEEAVCNVIGFKAMAAFGQEKFKALSRERRTMQRVAREGAEQSRATVEHYERLAALYAHHERSAMPQDVFLRERGRIFRSAERRLAWPKGTMNNVWIANAMTYSRHYPLVERVYDALGRDLARTVAFFKHVDKSKPTPAEVMERNGLQSETSVEFVRAYEAAIVEAIEKALAAPGTRVRRL